jgi:NuA3 HAT complex component NTO1
LEVLRSKVEERAYVTVTPFVTELANIFRDKVGFGSNTGGPVKLTPEQKDIKLRANRIIGKVKVMLIDAARKEAELGLKPDVDEDGRRVAMLLENCLKADTGSAHPSVAGQDDHEEDNEVRRELNGNIDSTGESILNSLTNHHHDADGDINMTDGSNSNGHTSKHQNVSTATTAREARDEFTDTAVIRLQIGPGQTIPISNMDGTDGSIPALSNSGSTNPSTTHADPLTPPRSEKDLLAPLTHGGIAWYLEPFEPQGTTVYDERWSGREVLRGMSEELSELDDEVLNGLVDEEMQDAVAAEGFTSNTLKVIPAHKKKAPPRRKRLR